jgi:hypothetical protein
MGGGQRFVAWNLDISPVTTGHQADMSEAIKMLAAGRGHDSRRPDRSRRRGFLTGGGRAVCGPSTSEKTKDAYSLTTSPLL